MKNKLLLAFIGSSSMFASYKLLQNTKYKHNNYPKEYCECNDYCNGTGYVKGNLTYEKGYECSCLCHD